MSASRRDGRDDVCRLDLDQQKTRAKELRRAVAGGEPGALALFHRHHPKAEGLSADDVSTQLGRLSDAQLVIARELGLASWPKLKAHAESLDRARRAIEEAEPAPDGDMPTVHVRCGSDIKTRLGEAGFVGDFLEIADPLWIGPHAADGVDVAARARVITGSFGYPSAAVEAGFRAAYQALFGAADRYKRIVLWFERDIYDQFCLARTLAALAPARKRADGGPRVELIVIDSFPRIERFVGLGQLSPVALRSLWESRKSATAAQSRLGVAVWRSICEPTPAALAALAAGGTPELPTMAPALTRHLQDLPWTGDGLTLTQRTALQVLAEGPKTYSELFSAAQILREPLPSMGDGFFWVVLRGMLAVADPPLWTDATALANPGPHARFELRPAGEALLTVARDWMEAKPPERWVGNVRIAPDGPVWRWSPEEGRPVLT